VEVKYIDTDTEGLEAYPYIARVIRTGYRFPIISVNGQPRLAGGIDVEEIKKIVEEASS